MAKKAAPKTKPVIHLLIVGLTVAIILLGLLLTGIKVGYKQALYMNPVVTPTPTLKVTPTTVKKVVPVVKK